MTTPHRRILVGVAFDDTSDRAIRAALSLASAAGDTDVFVLYAEPPAHGGQRDVSVLDESLERLKAKVDANLEEFKSHHADVHVPSITLEIGIGTPAKTICEYADRLGVGLVVVGTHGRKGIVRAMLGSVAHEVLQNAHCPVLVMRPIEHVEAAPVPEIEPAPAPHAARHVGQHTYHYSGGIPSRAMRPWGF
jgi:nucleotide-binding universal stress UspA family protein